MGGAHQTVNRHGGIMNCTPCLSLWERWPSEARTERGDQGAIPSQSPAVTALPEGEPRDCTPHYVAYWHENGAYLYRYAPFTVLRPPIKEGVSLGQHRAIRQEVSDRIFVPIQSLENEGILYVFLVFQTEEVGQKDGGDSQTQLCGVALKFTAWRTCFSACGILQICLQEPGNYAIIFI